MLSVPFATGAVSAHADTAPNAAVSQEEALAAAKKSGRAVMVSSLLSSKREVRALPDGRFEATLHAAPVRTLKAGKWANIDTKLHQQNNGELVPAASTVGLRFSGGGGGPFVRMTRAGKELSLAWPYGKLPAPTVEGDTATYAEALPGVDLVLRATAAGFSHVLRVKTPQAAQQSKLARVELKLGASGVAVTPDGAGGLKAVDRATGGTVFSAPQPAMWDSTSQQATVPPGSSRKTGVVPEPPDLNKGPGDGSQHAPIKTTVANGKLTLEPNKALMTGPATKFPVYLDPDWQGPGESSAVMVSTSYSDASWEDEGMGLCDNTDPYMGGLCGSRPDSKLTKRLFYKFALPSAVMNTNILYAEFKPYQTGAYNCTPAEAEVWKTKGVSGSTSWGTQSASGFWQHKLVEKAFNYGNESVGCSNSTVVLSSDALKDEIDKTAHGSGSIWLGMKAGSESSSKYWKRFNNDAVLRVLYNLPPKPPTYVRMEAEGGYYPCMAINEAVPRLRVWPTMSARITDPQSSDKVQAEYVVGWGDAQGNNFKWRIGAGNLGPDSAPLYSGSGESGSNFTKALSLFASSRGIPKNIPIAWMVRGHDFKSGLEDGDPGHWQGASVWSDQLSSAGHKCWFVYDDAAPPPPKVTSSKYPNDPIEHDGVNQPGTFTITAAAGEPIAKFGYSFTPPGGPAEPMQYLALGANGCTSTACTITKTPDRKGDWQLNVSAVDQAGRGTSAPAYIFRVRNIATEDAHWRLDDPAGSTKLTDEIAAGELYQALSVNSGKCLNVEGGKTIDGAHVMQWDCEGVEWEKWKFTDLGNDVFTLTSKRSGKCLNVEGASTANGAHVIQSDCAAVDSQKWQRVQVADGTYKYVAKHSGKCLNVEGGKAANGAHLMQWDCEGVAWEQWRLTSVNQAALTGSDISLGSQARVGSTALRMNTDNDPATVGYAQTPTPVVNPASNYTVSAWAKLNSSGQYGTLVAQDGSLNSSFYLQYSQVDRRWAMSAVSGDQKDAPGVRALSSAAPTIGQWTYLVGVYDATAKQLKLYVDGKFQSSKPFDASAWATAARGPFTIGRAKFNGSNVDLFPGEIDDVRVFARAVTDQDVARWYRATAQARWRFNTPPNTDATIPDDSGAGHTLSLNGGAAIKDDGEACGAFSEQCLALDGTHADGSGSWAQTAGPVADTDGSFTIAGWVDAAKPTVPMTVFSAASAKQSAFTVRFNPKIKNDNYDPDRDDPSAEYSGGWELEIANSDSDTPTRTKVYSNQSCQVCANEGPDHLAVVYDAPSQTMTLYVNGAVDEVQSHSGHAGGVVTFKASGPFQIGRRFADGKTSDTDANREYFSGVIDDVWVYKGALTDEEAQTIKGALYADTFQGNPQLPADYN